MNEDRQHSALLELLSTGATLEEHNHGGRRFTLHYNGQRVDVPGALAAKLVRERQVRRGGQSGTLHLWFAVRRAGTCAHP
ncbi:hypothetical protein [Metallibacterium scheffleri]|nr:hypothetical protein [Metallibacterium scheffleri]